MGVSTGSFSGVSVVPGGFAAGGVSGFCPASSFGGFLGQFLVRGRRYQAPTDKHVAYRRSLFKLAECPQHHAGDADDQQQSGNDGEPRRFFTRLAKILRHGRFLPKFRHCRLGLFRFQVQLRRSLLLRRVQSSMDDRRRRRLDLFFGLGQPVHPLAGGRIDFGRLAQDQGENLMRRGHFGQMGIRVEADLFEIDHSFRGQRVVEILGDGVGVETGSAFGQARRAEPLPPHNVSNSMDQARGVFALLDLFTQVLGIARIEYSVQICQ